MWTKSAHFFQLFSSSLTYEVFIEFLLTDTNFLIQTSLYQGFGLWNHRFETTVIQLSQQTPS